MEPKKGGNMYGLIRDMTNAEMLVLGDRCDEIVSRAFDVFKNGDNALCVEIDRFDGVGIIAAELLVHLGILENFAESERSFVLTDRGKKIIIKELNQREFMMGL